MRSREEDIPLSQGVSLMYQIALFIHILGVLCLMGGHTLIHASLELTLRLG